MYKEAEEEVAGYLSTLKALEAIRELDARVIMYTKNQEANKTAIQLAFATDEVQILGNRGWP